MIKDARQIYAVRDKAGWDRRVAVALQRAGLLVRRQDIPAAAYVSDSRWVADCANCGSGIGVWPDHARATCLECGYDWPIAFPGRVEDAVELLTQRPPGNRHWFPHLGEAIEDLQAENDVMLGDG
ncbi:MAG: hypothetical protein M3O70_08920 [Actinomycetota bacterium]|nr:hypothetical protein [Actinomycetota bacterium]